MWNFFYFANFCIQKVDWEGFAAEENIYKKFTVNLHIADMSDFSSHHRARRWELQRWSFCLGIHRESTFWSRSGYQVNEKKACEFSAEVTVWSIGSVPVPIPGRVENRPFCGNLWSSHRFDSKERRQRFDDEGDETEIQIQRFGITRAYPPDC